MNKEEDKREIEILRELQANSTRWFSQEEWNRLKELMEKYKPKGKYNERIN